MAIAFGKIANALQSAASDHILGISQDIYDTTLNAYQSDLNLKVKQLYTTVNDEYPLLLTPPGQTADSNTTTYFSTNVTINPNLGKITALRFARPGGKSTEFLKADGSLDTNTYATTTTLGNYLPLSGGTLTGALTIKKSSYEMITLERTDSANSVLISFKNTNGLLGWLGMTGSANQGIIRFTADLNTSYTVLDSGNYNSYTPILNSTSTHATKSSVIYAPTTAGTSGQYLTSNGSGAPTWTSLTTLKNPYSLKLKNTEGTVVTYDGSEAKDLSGGVYQSTISNYLNETNISYGPTLGESKTKLLTESVKSGRRAGHFITILSETVNKWNQPDDYIYTTQGGIGSLFKIGGGYANSSYSTWIASDLSTHLGVVRQLNSVWKQMRYLAWTSDIPTTLKNPYSIKFTNTTGTAISYDGSSTVDLSSGINYATKSSVANNGIFYIEGTGTTAGIWLGTHDKITSYYKGLTIAYKIPIAGASTTTLNINNLGAITVKRNTSNLTTHIPVNSVIVLVYDGTNFMWSDYDSTDTSTLRLYYQRFKAGTNGIKQYSLILKDADGNWQSLTRDYGTGSTKTVNNAKFDLSDLCHLYYASNNITSGSTTTVGYIYKIYSLADIRYSTNYTSTVGMTADKMVYIVGTIDSEGYFRLDSTWYTQILEENIDKVYIPIGYAYDTYRIMFNGFLKPICYRNRSFVEYDPLKIHRINIGEAIYEPTYGIVTLPSSYPANGGTADKLGSTTMGSTTQPIYLNNGTPTLCTSYSALLTALTNNNNQISLTVGGTTKTLTVNYANNSGISDNALLFQDMSTLPVANDNMPWEKIVMVDNKGVSDIGTELRFNYDNDATSGGTVLLCTGQYQNTVLLPDRDGTLALVEDLQGLGGTTSGYWANVPISSSASNVTTPIFKTVNIGITTSTHVTNGRATLSLVTTSANPCDFWLGADNTPYWSITVRNSADSANSKGFNIYDNIAKKYRLRIFTNGNVQIGESSSQKGNLTVNGSVNALDGFFETSDSRLKNFLNEIQIDFDKLSQLPKMYFTWKADEKEMPDLQIGTSAQELQKIYPELVGEVDGHLTVAYDKLSIIALKAIDELYTMNVELKKQNAKLKSKVDRLERRVYYGKKY